jgi:HNH endonuclease
MSSKFPQRDVDELLVRCHRRCCLCHRFCGVKIETDHIVPAAEGGEGAIENAIALCFECHAEIHSYNDKHPRGRKFHPNELRMHKEQWLKICETKPEIFVEANRNADVGPLQALIDELDFNSVVSRYSSSYEQGCSFLDEQFRRATREGAVAILNELLKKSILEAYVAMGRANQSVSGAMSLPRDSNSWAEGSKAASEAIIKARPKIEEARKELLSFLSSE